MDADEAHDYALQELPTPTRVFMLTTVSYDGHTMVIQKFVSRTAYFLWQLHRTRGHHGTLRQRPFDDGT